jgi:hypothetical protein
MMPPLISQLLAYGSHQLANMLESEHANDWPIHCFKNVAVVSTYPFVQLETSIVTILEC